MGCMSRPPTRRLNSVVLGLVAIAAVALCHLAPAAADALPDVYVDNRKLAGSVVRVGNALFVDAVAAAKALKRAYVAGSPPTLDGHPLLSARTLRGTVHVRLDELAAIAGAQVRTNPAVGIIDVITFDPKARARAIGEDEQKRRAALVRSAPRPTMSISPTSDADLRDIYQIAVQQLKINLGIQLAVEPSLHLVPADEIHREMRSSVAMGYTNALLSGGTLTLDVYVAQGLSYDRTLHVVLHELTHCWQHGAGLNTSTTRITEGFAEWASAFVLESMGYTDEVKRINDNLLEDYAEGYRYFARRAAEVGPLRTVEDMRGHRLSR